MRRGGTLEEAVWFMNMADVTGNGRNDRETEVHDINKKHARDGNDVRIAEIATTTLSPSGHIINDGQDVLYSRFLRSFQVYFRVTGHTFLSFHVVMIIIMSAFVHAVAVVAFDSCREHSRRNKLKKAL